MGCNTKLLLYIILKQETKIRSPIDKSQVFKEKWYTTIEHTCLESLMMHYECNEPVTKQRKECVRIN